MFVPSRKACEMLGVYHGTLRNWANQGRIKYIRMPGGNRLYDVETFIGEKEGKTKVCYCRVSSKKQENDLERQIKFVKNRYPNHEVITDIGSGINFKRKGFISLLERIDEGEVEELVVAHRDRLCRFGFDFIEWYCERNGCKIVVLDEVKLSPQQELVQDILSIIHVFSCRIHGLRNYASQIEKDKNISVEEGQENP